MFLKEKREYEEHSNAGDTMDKIKEIYLLNIF
jgi:hypothetical protein